MARRLQPFGRVKIARIMGLIAGLLACGGEPQSPVGPRCAATRYRAQIAVQSIDRLDVLFVIDDSESMAAAQTALQRKLAALMHTLLRGDPGDSLTEARKDVHVAVIPDRPAAGPFDASLADVRPASAPDFLAYRSLYAGFDNDLPGEFVGKVMARLPDPTVGTRRQPLAAADAVLRVAARGADSDDPFLRLQQAEGLAQVLVIVVTDGDDCSGPADGPADPLACAKAPERLQDLARYRDWPDTLFPPEYVNLFHLVVIAGVPEEFADDIRRPSGGAPDEWIDDYYADMLAHPAMQIRADPADPLRPVPACQSADAKAAPARRLVELARSFGRSARVHSLCGWDPVEVARPFITRLWDREPGYCESEPPRDERGLTACTVSWDLLPVGSPGAEGGTPTRCAERPYLTPSADRPTTDAGGERCDVQQLPVHSDADLAALDPGGDGEWGDQGFYFDDFSEEVTRDCGSWAGGPGRFVFTDFAQPMSGIMVTVHCEEVVNRDDPEAVDECVL